MDVHHVLQDNIVVVDLDPLGDASNGKELLVLVELNAGHNRTVVEHVGRVGESGEGSDAVAKIRLEHTPCASPVVSSERGEAGSELIKTRPSVSSLVTFTSLLGSWETNSSY